MPKNIHRCDEVMEELVNMREHFERLFQRLTKQVVEMRREMTDGNNKIKSKAQSRAHISSSEPSPRKSKHCKNKEAITDDDDDDRDFNNDNNIDNDSDDWSPLANVKKEQAAKNNKNCSKNIRPALDFFGIPSRVMPMKPFTNSEEFEDWDKLLKNDEDQREHLRFELMQGHSTDPDKYIQQTWRSILSDKAAYVYSYRGFEKTKRKAIKDHNWTEIFKECFLKRFKQKDVRFFMKSTFRYFHHAHLRVLRNSRRKKEKEPLSDIEFETANLGTMDDSLEDILD